MAKRHKKNNFLKAFLRIDSEAAEGIPPVFAPILMPIFWGFVFAGLASYLLYLLFPGLKEIYLIIIGIFIFFLIRHLVLVFGSKKLLKEEIDALEEEKEEEGEAQE